MSASASITLIKQACDQLGVPLPKPITTALADADKLVAALPTERGNVTGAVLDAIQAGRDPLADPEVLRQVVAAQLRDANVAHLAQLRADDQVADVIRGHADDLLALWAAALTGPAAALADAARLGVTDLSTAAQLKGEKLIAWAAAAASIEAFTAAQQGVTFLFVVLDRAGPQRPDQLLVLADPGFPQLQTARAATAHDKRLPLPWALARAGVPIEPITCVNDLTRRENRAIDGVVEPLADDDQHSNNRRAAVSN
jgi:hypothetical protein